jgi:iron complex transport system substrate-binding protein
MSFSSPLSIPYALEHLVPELAAAVDGDPSTPVPSAQGILTAAGVPPSTSG